MKTFLEMTRTLTATEQSLQWNAETNPDRAVPKGKTDPLLTPCPNCKGEDVTFMRFEHPGSPKFRGGPLRHNVDYYVQCTSCKMQTLPRKSKKLAAETWATGGKGNFIHTP
jgi:hypothetical protein